MKYVGTPIFVQVLEDVSDPVAETPLPSIT